MEIFVLFAVIRATWRSAKWLEHRKQRRKQRRGISIEIVYTGKLKAHGVDHPHMERALQDVASAPPAATGAFVEIQVPA